MTEKEEQLALRVACGSYLLTNTIVRKESDLKRRRKMEKVLRIKRNAIASTFPEFTGQTIGVRVVKATLTSGRWTMEDRTGFVIEMSFTYPVLPYELDVDDEHFVDGLGGVARTLGVSDGDVQRLLAVKAGASDVLKHRSSALRKLAYGGGAVAGLALVLAAPYAVAAVGAATSGALGGAAATAHGLALLGGGSLAAGGTGMAGGMAVVGIAGASASGLAGLSAKRLIDELPPEAVDAQLVKAIVAFELLDVPARRGDAVIDELVAQLEELRRQQVEEDQLNEEKATRVKDLKRKIASYEKAIAHVEAILAASES